MHPFVLVGGWAGSGKTTLSRALAAELGLACLAKDEVKEALMDAVGAPTDVPASRALGVAAVHAVLRLSRRGHRLTWYPYTLPLVLALPGPCVEVRCRVPVRVARERYYARSRDARRLDGQRSHDELWGAPVDPLGVGPLVEVDTSRPVDAAALSATIRGLGVSRA